MKLVCVLALVIVAVYSAPSDVYDCLEEEECTKNNLTMHSFIHKTCCEDEGHSYSHSYTYTNGAVSHNCQCSRSGNIYFWNETSWQDKLNNLHSWFHINFHH